MGFRPLIFRLLCEITTIRLYIAEGERHSDAVCRHRKKPILPV